MNKLNLKLKMHCHLFSTPKNEILRCKSNKICTRFMQGNHKTLMKDIKYERYQITKYMDSNYIFMDRKTQ